MDEYADVILTVGAGGEQEWKWLGGEIAQIGWEIWKLQADGMAPCMGAVLHLGPWLCEVVGSVSQPRRAVLIRQLKE